MRNVVGDYQWLRSLKPEFIHALIRGEFPDGAPVRWCFAQLDNALTDSFSGNSESAEDFQARIQLAVILLEVASASQAVSEVVVAPWYMKFSRRALEKGLKAVPSPMTPDAVALFVLRLFRLTIQEAVAVAARRRTAELRSLSGTPSEPAGTRESRSLSIIESLLRDLAWFVDKVENKNSSDEIRSWLAIRHELAFGEEVVRLRGERMAAVMHANFISELKVRALSGEAAAELAYWLREMFGDEFTYANLSDCFADAFSIDRETLLVIENWIGFETGGSLSDDDINRALEPLIHKGWSK